MGMSFEAGDHLVLSVPVVRVAENDPWSTVTFALASGQWVTIPQGTKDVIKVLKGSADALIEGGRRRERVQEASIRPAADGETTVVFKLESGESEFEFAGDELARFAGKAVSEASRLAATADEASFATGGALDVSAISVDGHASDTSSVQLAIEVGRLKLAFDLEANTLLRAVKLYLDRRKSERSALANADSKPAASAVNGHSLEAADGS